MTPTQGHGWPQSGARMELSLSASQPAVAPRDAQAPLRLRARVVVKSRDPRLRALIVERLNGLADIIEVESDGLSAGHDAPISENGGPSALTPREAEVLGLLADGLANKQIASRLGITAHTAKFHVDSLLHKLSAANRAEAVSLGIRKGLIDL